MITKAEIKKEVTGVDHFAKRPKPRDMNDEPNGYILDSKEVDVGCKGPIRDGEEASIA